MQLSAVAMVMTGVIARRGQKDRRHKRAKSTLKLDKVAKLWYGINMFLYGNVELLLPKFLKGFKNLAWDFPEGRLLCNAQ